MKKITVLCFTLLMLSFNWMSAQNGAKDLVEDELLITETIEMYFDGWLTGDTIKLGGAMHATCKLKNIKDNEVLVFDRAKYLSFFSPRPKLENAGGHIVSVDITGPIASAKCRLQTADRVFTDYFNMMKLEDRWYIVDKISTNVAKE